MKITNILCNPKKLLHKPGGALIRFVEETGFSHCAVLCEFSGFSFVFHAVWPKVRRDSYSQFLSDYEIYKTYTYEIDVNETIVYNYFMMLTGRRYSIAQLVLILLRRISGVIKRLSLGWILNHENKLICSEVCALWMMDFLRTMFVSKPDSIGLIEIEQKNEELKAV